MFAILLINLVDKDQYGYIHWNYEFEQISNNNQPKPIPLL